MTKREQFVEEAKSWINTPFHHQGRTKGRGCDCLGLILGAASNVGINPYDDSIKYSHHVHTPTLIRNLRKYLVPISFEESKPGDILLLVDKGDPVHLGIRSEKGFIHSYAQSRRVTDQIINEEWRNKILSVFRFPEIDNG